MHSILGLTLFSGLTKNLCYKARHPQQIYRWYQTGDRNVDWMNWTMDLPQVQQERRYATFFNCIQSASPWFGMFRLNTGKTKSSWRRKNSSKTFTLKQNDQQNDTQRYTTMFLLESFQNLTGNLVICPNIGSSPPSSETR